jgi:hypothetical protein
MSDSWTKTVEVGGREFEVLFIRRPFREGYEVHVDVDGVCITIGDLGLGDTAALERVRSAIAEQLDKLGRNIQ